MTPSLERIPEALRSLPWKKIPEYVWEMNGEFNDRDSVLFAIGSEWENVSPYDIFGAEVVVDEERGFIRAIENANREPIAFEISDCDWYLILARKEAK